MPTLTANSRLVVILSLFLLNIWVYTIAGDTGWQQNGAVYNITMNEECFSNDTDACEPGYHLNHEDTPCDNDRKCCYCPPDTYQPWWNKCASCISCTNCSEMQKETMHHCNITHNSVCGKHLITTAAPEDTPVIPNTTQVPSYAITPDEEVINKLPEDVDDTIEDEEQEETVHGFWCEPIMYTFYHFFTHLLCLLPGILFVIFPSWPLDINLSVKNTYSRCKERYYRFRGHHNPGRGQYNHPQGN